MQVTIYKQKPGSDIDAGWYVVVHSDDRTYPSINDRHIGPYRYKREAMKAARSMTDNAVKCA